MAYDVAWPWRGNLNGYKFSKTYRTSIQQDIYYNSEKRQALYITPIKSMEFEVYAPNRVESIKLRNAVYINQHKIWGVPQFHYGTKTTASSDSGTLELFCDIAPDSLEDPLVAGDKIVINYDNTKYEVNEVFSVNGSEITCDAALSNTYPAGTWIGKIIECTMDYSLDMTPIKKDFTAVKVKFTDNTRYDNISWQ